MVILIIIARDAEKAALEDNTSSNASLPRSPSSSSARLSTYSSTHQPNSGPHPEDLYSIPRSVLAPSPNIRPHPFSRTTSNSTPYAQSTASSDCQLDYDIPRSLLNRHHGSANSLIDTTKSAATNLGLLQHQSKNTNTSSSSSVLSSEPLSQADYLRDEYPDYDVPKLPKDYLDYDVPKPYHIKNLKSQSSTKNGNGIDSTRNAVSTPDISFGDLDSIMAEINLQVLEAQQLSAHHKFLDEKSSLEIQQSLLAKQLAQHVQQGQKAKQQEEARLEKERQQLLLHERQEQERRLLESKQRLERHKQQLLQQQISLDIAAMTRDNTTQKAVHTRAFSEDNTTSKEADAMSTKNHNGARYMYDCLPSGMTAKILSDQDVRTAFPGNELCEIPEPPSHLADLGKQFKVSINS